MTESTLEMLEVGALRMRVAMQGSSPLVLLCHGFPELWYSWRNQLSALAANDDRCRGPLQSTRRRRACLKTSRQPPNQRRDRVEARN